MCAYESCTRQLCLPCIYVHIYTHIYLSIYLSISISIFYIYNYIYMYERIYVYIYIELYTATASTSCIYVCMYIYIHIYTLLYGLIHKSRVYVQPSTSKRSACVCMYVQICTYIHTQTYALDKTLTALTAPTATYRCRYEGASARQTLCLVHSLQLSATHCRTYHCQATAARQCKYRHDSTRHSNTLN